MFEISILIEFIEECMVLNIYIFTVVFHGVEVELPVCLKLLLVFLYLQFNTKIYDAIISCGEITSFYLKSI